MTSRIVGRTLQRFAIAAFACGFFGNAAMAQSHTYHFEISHQTLSAALREYAKVSGQQIIFTEGVVANAMPVELHGDFTAQAALARLLSGTDLVAERSPSGALMIHRPNLQGSANGLQSAAANQSMHIAEADSTEATVPAGTNQNPIASGEGDALAKPQDLSEIVVTGSRISRPGGFEAPSPVTVIDQEQIQSAAKTNLADYVNELPSLVGSATPQNSNLSFSNGQAGINALNLRGLGTVRTLVLVDGQRSVGSAITGIVDINDLPQALVSRVEVVTGGASAAYGSDAVAGVVNFILDKKYTGFKSEVSGGETTYGDDPDVKVTATWGVPFADGRGHFLLNGEYSYIGGIWGVPRAWNNSGAAIMENPAYGTATGVPERLAVSGAGLDTATLGGIITNTALRGTVFGPGGIPGQFNYGTLTRDPWTVGGDAASNQFNYFNTLDQEITRNNLFTRGSFDVTDNFEVFAQLSRSHSDTLSEQLKQFNVGNLSIHAGNPFIPASVAQQMTAQGISQFTLGTMNNDLPAIQFSGARTVSRYVVGMDGKFDLFAKTWNWDGYYQKGVTRTDETGYNISSKARFANALDAVTSPTTGAPICRITLANPNSGCVPYDPMGLGVNSSAALNYLLGSPNRHQQFTQDVAAATLRGEPFSSWAGPVSIAAGIEHRREAVDGDADPTSLINGWFAGNYLPTFGSYRVTEGFAETLVPLAKNLPGMNSVDFNAAVRRTDYSTSGMVTTWKLGLTWQPIDDFHFRVTRSRDIRAPNLNELFAAGTANTNTVLDPFNGNAATQYQGKAIGNPALQPEVADTLGLGIVLTPTFLHNFNASIDYFDIKIRDAIGSVDAQTIVNYCYEGSQSYCSAVTRGVGPGGTSVITQISLLPFNMAALRARGVDLEASYRLSLDTLMSQLPGAVSFRALATHYLEDYTNSGIVGQSGYDLAGSNGFTNGESGVPSWMFNGTLAYSYNPVTMSLTARGISAGTNSNTFIQCTTGCPPSTVNNPTISNNRLPGAVYFDLSASYKLKWGGSQVETFLSVQNLTNRDPAVVPQGPGGLAYATPATNPTLYDQLGRIYRAGVRVAF